MTRTRTAPWDYERRYATPDASLFGECPNCGSKYAVWDGWELYCYEDDCMTVAVEIETDPLELVDDWAADPECVASLEDDPNRERREAWQGFLSRMNAPEMVQRRGTELTPYGWRNP